MYKSFFNIMCFNLFMKLTFHGISCNNDKINNIDNNIKPNSSRRYKILHTMSYQSPLKWIDNQFNEFKEPLKNLNLEYKSKIREYKKKADTVALLGIFKFKDKNGRNILLEDVAKWTVENNRKPEFIFREDRINKGNLFAVTVLTYEQYYVAGKIVWEIFINNKKTVSFPY